jgi:chromosome segregation ATPase
LEEELKNKANQIFDQKQAFEEKIKTIEENKEKMITNLREDLRQKSQRLSETNIALAKAADKIEELTELKQGYQFRSKTYEKEVKECQRELASKKDFLKKIEKENKDLRKHLKFKDKELIRISKEKKIETEQLQSELHLQRENNKVIIEKIKNIKIQKKCTLLSPLTLINQQIS